MTQRKLVTRVDGIRQHYHTAQHMNPLSQYILTEQGVAFEDTMSATRYAIQLKNENDSNRAMLLLNIRFGHPISSNTQEHTWRINGRRIYWMKGWNIVESYNNKQLLELAADVLVSNGIPLKQNYSIGS